MIDSSYKFEEQETISQSHQTDIDFLTKLAGDEVYPFTARLVGNTFHYEKMGKELLDDVEGFFEELPPLLLFVLVHSPVCGL